MKFGSASTTCTLSALAALAASSSASALTTSDVHINLVDGRGISVPGLDVLVHRGDGSALIPAMNSGGQLVVQDAGNWITITLPGLDSSASVQLDGSFANEVTFEVVPGKGLSGVASVKPMPPVNPFALGVGGPANDDCGNAIPIGEGDTAFDTTGATTDGTVGSNNNEIWYTHTASCTGTLTVSTCNQASFDTDLILMTADSTCGAQTALAINDDATGCAGNSSLLTASVVAGETYLLSVGGFGDGQTGTGTLSISCTAAAANDFCEGAESVALNSSVTFNNVTGSTSPSDPEFSCHFQEPAQGFGTTWFSFVADGNSVLLDTSNSMGSTDTLIGVYEGGCDGLVEIACGEDIDFDNQNFLTQVVASGLTPGAEYLVQVASFGTGSLGEITLDVTAGPLLESRNGSGVNPHTLTAPIPALIGMDFPLEVTPGDGPTTVFVANGQNQVDFPPFGELLIDPDPRLILNSLNGSHVISVPNLVALVGIEFNAQALVNDLSEITNAIDFVVGSF